MAIPSDLHTVQRRRDLSRRPIPGTFRPPTTHCSDSEWSSSSSSSSSSSGSSRGSNLSGSSSSTLKASPSSSWDFADSTKVNPIPGLHFRQRSDKMRLGLPEGFLDRSRKESTSSAATAPMMPTRPAPAPPSSPSLSGSPQPMARVSSRGILNRRPASRDRPGAFQRTASELLATPTRGSSMGVRSGGSSPPTASPSSAAHRRSRSLMPDSPGSRTTPVRHRATSSTPSSNSTISPSKVISVTPRSTSQTVMTPSIAAANARLTEAMLNELEDNLASSRGFEDKPYSPPSDAEMISLPSCDSIALFALGFPSSSGSTELSMASAPAVGTSSPRRAEKLPSSSFSTLSASNSPSAPLRLGGVPDRAELIKPWVEQVSQAAQRSVGAAPLRSSSAARTSPSASPVIEAEPSAREEQGGLRERRSKAPLTLRLAKSQSSMGGNGNNGPLSANSLRSGLRSPGIYSPPPCPPPTAPLPNLPSMQAGTSTKLPISQLHGSNRRSVNALALASPSRGEVAYQRSQSQAWRISTASNISGASSFKTSAESLRSSIDARSGFSSVRNSHLSTASSGGLIPSFASGSTTSMGRRSRGMTIGGYRLSTSTELSYYSDHRSESPSGSSSSAFSHNSPKTPLTPLDTLNLPGMQHQSMMNDKGSLGVDALAQLANALQLEHSVDAAHHQQTSHAQKESRRFSFPRNTMPGHYQEEEVVYGIAM